MSGFAFIWFLVKQVKSLWPPKIWIVCIVSETRILIIQNKSYKKMLNKRGPKIEPCRTTNIRLIFILFFYSKGNLESFSSRKKTFLLSTAFFLFIYHQKKTRLWAKKAFWKTALEFWKCVMKIIWKLPYYKLFKYFGGNSQNTNWAIIIF